VTRPVLLAVDDEPAAAALVEQELGKRYGADYRVVCERSPVAALRALEDARDRGVTFVSAPYPETEKAAGKSAAFAWPCPTS